MYLWLNQMIIIKWELIACCKVSRVFSYSKSQPLLPKGNAGTRLPARNLWQRITWSSKRLPTFLKGSPAALQEQSMSTLKCKLNDKYWLGRDADPVHSSATLCCEHMDTGRMDLNAFLSLHYYHFTICINVRIMPLLVWTADWQIQLTGHLLNSQTNVLKHMIRTPCPAPWPQHHHPLTTCPPRLVPQPHTHGRDSLPAPASPSTPPSRPRGPCSGPQRKPWKHHSNNNPDNTVCFSFLVFSIFL